MPNMVNKLQIGTTTTMNNQYILAIDPGNAQSAFVLLDAGTLEPIQAGIVENGALVQVIAEHPDKDATAFAIEMVASYGMPVGAEIFETVFWIGRFYAAAGLYHSRSRIFRIDVKMHLCHNSRAKDSNVRQALIDRFGPVGTKKAPGWFYGFKADMWAAYAVGVTYADNINMTTYAKTMDG